MALTVYDELSPTDVASGRTIAGTGTLAIDGTVGEIGGIEAKARAAQAAGADLFLAPAGQAADARRVLGDAMPVIGVTTFDDALQALAAAAVTAGRGSAVDGDQAGPHGAHHRIELGVGIELRHRVADVVLDRVCAEEQLLGDLLGRQPVGGELEHLDLAVGQFHGVDLVEPAEMGEVCEHVAGEVRVVIGAGADGGHELGRDRRSSTGTMRSPRRAPGRARGGRRRR